jgi:hypothetical protein
MTKPASRTHSPRRSIEVLMEAYLAQLVGGKRRVREAGGSGPVAERSRSDRRDRAM